MQHRVKLFCCQTKGNLTLQLLCVPFIYVAPSQRINVTELCCDSHTVSTEAVQQKSTCKFKTPQHKKAVEI